MLEFLSAIGDAFSAIISFIVNIVNGLIFLVGMIPKAMGIITVSFGYLPSVFVAMATAGIAICIVYLLIGR